MGFCTLANVKEYLKKADSDTGDDAFLSGAIIDISGMLEAELGRIIEAADVSNEVRDGDGTDTIFTKETPINSITSVETRYTVGGDWSEVDSGDYVYGSGTGRIILTSGIFPEGRSTVRLNYNAGYSTIPAPLKLACIQLVALHFLDSRRGGGRLGKSSESLPDAESQGFIIRKLPEDLQKAVMRYKRRHV